MISCRVVSVFFFKNKESVAKRTAFAVMEASLAATTVYQIRTAEADACKMLDDAVHKGMQALLSNGGPKKLAAAQVFAGVPAVGEELSWHTVSIKPTPGNIALPAGSELMASYSLEKGRLNRKANSPS